MRVYGKHFNGDLPVVCHIVTSGPDFNEHEVLQIAMIPLLPSLELDEGRHILDLYIKPEKPIAPKVRKTAERAYKRAEERGHPAYKALSIFDHWFANLDLGRSRIAPIGYRYRKTSAFLRNFIGHANYEATFDDDEIRDVETIARFGNDLTDSRGEMFMFTNFWLEAFARTMRITSDFGKPTALTEAAIIQRIYIGMINEFHKRMI